MEAAPINTITTKGQGKLKNSMAKSLPLPTFELAFVLRADVRYGAMTSPNMAHLINQTLGS